MKSILNNYKALIKAFQLNLEETNAPPDMKAQLVGIMAVMEKIETYFAFQLAYLILRHTDDIAKSLQKSGLSAAEGSTLVMNALEGLKEESNNFDQFWEKVNENAEKDEVDEPVLGRKRKRTEKMNFF